MVNMLTLFPRTVGAEKIDELLSTLIPSMKGATGLLLIKVSDGPLRSPAGRPSYTRVLEVSWKGMDALMVWTQTPAAQTDKDFMIKNGAVMFFYDVDDPLI
jgi:hypothetical protein